MAVFEVDKTINTDVILDQLKDEVNADAAFTGAGSTNLITIVWDGVTTYTFIFDDSANDNDDLLTTAENTALDNVIAAHTPSGQPPTEPPTDGFKTKAGRILAASFGGTPKTYNVVFGTPFKTWETYVVTFSVRVTNQKTQYIPVVSSFDETGFTVSLGTSSISSLTEVCWIAMVAGEE